MEWELREILYGVKKLYFTNVHVVERLMLYNSLAQNTAMAVLNKQRGKKSAVLSLEQMEAIDCFEQLRQELILPCHEKPEKMDKAFYRMRRQLIENIQTLIFGTAKLPQRAPHVASAAQPVVKVVVRSQKIQTPVVPASEVVTGAGR